jgi:hypothetical protein
MSTVATLVCAAAENAIATSTTAVSKVRRKILMGEKQITNGGGSQSKKYEQPTGNHMSSR